MSGNWYQAHFWGPLWVSQELFSKVFLRWRGIRIRPSQLLSLVLIFAASVESGNEPCLGVHGSRPRRLGQAFVQASVQASVQSIAASEGFRQKPMPVPDQAQIRARLVAVPESSRSLLKPTGLRPDAEPEVAEGNRTPRQNGTSRATYAGFGGA
ncbi:hypothetical protein B0H14DRAFT_2563485 [Mycena olivaceomarginata]|nr:hypothetical protein B0H14DRAFT_2563485 [Mycena olivaceomarginata]